MCVSNLRARAACRALVVGTVVGVVQINFPGSLVAGFGGHRCGSGGGGGGGEVSVRPLRARASLVLCPALFHVPQMCRTVWQRLLERATGPPMPNKSSFLHADAFYIGCWRCSNSPPSVLQQRPWTIMAFTQALL
jgi:hypothetical protein